ncbi:hypothetical protein [Streptomyces sp. WELS2]|uniref:hypothetical protein n=1 Tax=Streptomyces sp. WELS2 TaxID=2749435 RepID=UPI0015F11ABA|nr:hypothetical protein [Streptomyces sp. WELS2]
MSVESAVALEGMSTVGASGPALAGSSVAPVAFAGVSGGAFERGYALPQATGYEITVHAGSVAEQSG